MVDCGSRRCAQERRSLRRDLQSLSKKLPVILGLESIAAVFAKNDGEDPSIEQPHQLACRDFQSTNRCFYCEKKLPNIYKRIHRIVNDAEKGKENKGKICLRSLQDLIPFCLDFYTHGFGRELFSDSVKNYFTVPPPDNDDEPKVCSAQVTYSDHPRQLSIPSTSVGTTKQSKQHLTVQSNCSKPSTSRLFDDKILADRKRDAMSMMHSIPETVIDLKDVKQEPESYLSERDIGGLADEADLYNMFLSQIPGLDLREKNHFMDYKDILFPFALQSMFLNSPMAHHPGYLPHNSTLLKELHLAQIRRMHNLDGVNRSHPRPAHGNQLKMPILISIVRKLVHEKFMEIKKYHRKNRQKMMDEGMEEEEEKLSNTPCSTFMPFPAALLSSYSENDYTLRNGSNFSNMTSEDELTLKRFGKVNECSRIGDTLKDIIVKRIAEKVKIKDGSSDENSCPSSPSFNDSRHLSKSGLPFGYFNSIPSLSPKPYKNDVASTSHFDGDYCSPPKRFKKDIVKSKCVSKKSSPDIGSSQSNVKKTRPKRGQYRKYNSQLLMDALRAVQSGEMSVHRAGSFFGVPHSTLEYKVKERHLLRQRKVKESHSSSLSSSSPKSDHQSLRLTIDLSGDSSPMPTDGPSVSSSSKKPDTPSTSSACADAKKDQTAQQDQLSISSTFALSSPSASSQKNGKKDISSSATWLQPYLSGGPSSSTGSTETFHPLPSLSLDNSASELLRKLQHKVQSSQSFSPDSISQLPFSKDPAFDIDSSSTALAGRFPVFNQSA